MRTQYANSQKVGGFTRGCGVFDAIEYILKTDFPECSAIREDDVITVMKGTTLTVLYDKDDKQSHYKHAWFHYRDYTVQIDCASETRAPQVTIGKRNSGADYIEAVRKKWVALPGSSCYLNIADLLYRFDDIPIRAQASINAFKRQTNKQRLLVSTHKPLGARKAVDPDDFTDLLAGGDTEPITTDTEDGPPWDLDDDGSPSGSGQTLRKPQVDIAPHRKGASSMTMAEAEEYTKGLS